jgi:hypothetical protein
VTDKPTLSHLTALGSMLGIKTAPVVGRLMPLVGAWQGPLIATIPHTFKALSVTANVARATAQDHCPWLAELAGDRIGLELGATTTIAHSEEAALPATTPELVDVLGDDLASVSYDGDAFTYLLAQANPDDAAVAATVARIDEVASKLGVTTPQRKTGGGLHRSLSRGMTSWVWLRARNGALDPVVALRWERVEWLPIQHMMNGFYPEIDAPTKISRLAKHANIEHCTVELLLGPVDPPGMRMLVELP